MWIKIKKHFNLVEGNIIRQTITRDGKDECLVYEIKGVNKPLEGFIDVILISVNDVETKAQDRYPKGIAGFVLLEKGFELYVPVDDTKFPRTLEAAIATFIKEAPSELLNEIKHMAEKEFISKYGYDWAGGIRNDYGLWLGNDSLLKEADSQHSNPDTASMNIVKAIWKKLYVAPLSPSVENNVISEAKVQKQRETTSIPYNNENNISQNKVKKQKISFSFVSAKMRRKILLILAGIILILIFTNPSSQDFKESMNDTPYIAEHYVSVSRHNYIIFSTFSYQRQGSDKIDCTHERYVGIMKNFWMLYQDSDCDDY